MVDALLEHPGGHRPADTTSRGQQLVDEALALGVAQQARRGRAAPRTAAAAASAGWCSAVGWNCMNSMSATATPARSAIARPSPVDSSRVGRDREQLTRRRRSRARTWVARISRTTPSASRAVDAAAAAALDDEVEGEPALVDGGGASPHGFDQRRARSRPRSPRPPACTTRGQRVAALAGQLEPRRRTVAVEHGAQRDELVDAAGSLVDEDADGVDVAQPGAGGERVGEVQVGGVRVAGEHRGDAALGPSRGGLIELALGEHADAQAERVGGPHRGRQAGDAAAEDEEVESPGPSPAIAVSRTVDADVVDEAGLAEPCRAEQAKLAGQRCRRRSAIAASTTAT